MSERDGEAKCVMMSPSDFIALVSEIFSGDAPDPNLHRENFVRMSISPDGAISIEDSAGPIDGERLGKALAECFGVEYISGVGMRPNPEDGTPEIFMPCGPETKRYSVSQ